MLSMCTVCTVLTYTQTNTLTQPLPHWDSVLSIELHDSAGDYNSYEELAKALVEETRCKGWRIHRSGT